MKAISAFPPNQPTLHKRGRERRTNGAHSPLPVARSNPDPAAEVRMVCILPFPHTTRNRSPRASRTHADIRKLDSQRPMKRLRYTGASGSGHECSMPVREALRFVQSEGIVCGCGFQKQKITPKWQSIGATFSIRRIMSTTTLQMLTLSME